jgi:hypothetical protein
VIAATALYGGVAPGLVAGITQFNVQLGTPPAAGGTNFFEVTVTLGNSTVSAGVYIAP